MNPVLLVSGCGNEGGCFPRGIDGDPVRKCPLHPTKADRDFIAMARTELPKALARIEELEGQING
jgi:hypothetical protein